MKQSMKETIVEEWIKNKEREEAQARETRAAKYGAHVTDEFLQWVAYIMQTWLDNEKDAIAFYWLTNLSRFKQLTQVRMNKKSVETFLRKQYVPEIVTAEWMISWHDLIISHYPMWLSDKEELLAA